MQILKNLDPKAWTLFQKFTLELIARGFEHYSADAVMHRVRWETAISTGITGGFKVNNDLTAFYARVFHMMNPAHHGFFRTRTSQYDSMMTVSLLELTKAIVSRIGAVQ